MSRVVQPVKTTLVSPARSVTPDLLDEWNMVDGSTLAVAVAKAEVNKKAVHKSVQAVKVKKALEAEAGMVHVAVKAEFAGRLSELAAALAAHDLARAAGRNSTMSGQEAIDNLAALLHHQLADSFASTSGGCGFERPAAGTQLSGVRSAGPHAHQQRARERRWAEHEATVTGKLGVMEGRVEQAVKVVEASRNEAAEQTKVQEAGLKELAARVVALEQAKAAVKAKEEAPVVKVSKPVGTVERIVTSLLDEIDNDFQAVDSAIPYLVMLVNDDAADSRRADEVARLLVHRGLSAASHQVGSYSLLCADLAAQARSKQDGSSCKVTGISTTAFRKLLSNHCLAAYPAAPNKSNAAGFIGELFDRGIVDKAAVHSVLSQLLLMASAGDEASAEIAYSLLGQVGEALDVDYDKALMDAHFARLKSASVSLALWNKSGNLVKLRASGWKINGTAVAVV